MAISIFLIVELEKFDLDFEKLDAEFHKHVWANFESIITTCNVFAKVLMQIVNLLRTIRSINIPCIVRFSDLDKFLTSSTICS